MIEFLSRYYALAVFIISGGALSFAYYAQYAWGMEPCVLCVYQRIPYWITFLLSGARFLGTRSLLNVSELIPHSGVSMIFSGISWVLHFLKRYYLLLCTLVFMSGAGIAFYHSGVEMKFFPAPISCSGVKKIKGLSVADLEKALMARPAVRCDQVALRILGFSATQWNFLIFLGLFGVSGLLWIKRR